MKVPGLNITDLFFLTYSLVFVLQLSCLKDTYIQLRHTHTHTYIYMVIFIYIYMVIYTGLGLYILEKAMAPHSSTLAWRIPWMEEPGGLQSLGSLRVEHG